MKKLNNKKIALIASIILTKNGTVNNKYAGKLANFFNCEKVRTWDMGNQSRKARELDWVIDLTEVVELCGYSAEYGNDAPRGGRWGEYVIKTGRVVEFNEAEFFEMIEASGRK